MAPSWSLVDIDKRYVSCPSGYYYSSGYCYRNSGWYWWGRWVFAAVVIVFVLAVLILFGCVNSRRRRRRGLAPRYGTGWMAPAHKFGAQNNPGGYQPPPPQYSATPMQNYPPQPQQPQYTGQTFNSNEGYYANHNEGVAPPPTTYYPNQRGGENVYEPPPGPPPGK